jgi:RecJ-like exonuclease
MEYKILFTRIDPKTGREIHQVECPKCGGDGIVSTVCRTCGMTGKQTAPIVFDKYRGTLTGGDEIDCWQCKGDGTIDIPCNECRGRGAYFIFE